MVVAALGAVASSSRGLTGEVSHAWHDLVSSDSTVSGTAAGRVFQFGSSRPGYWHQAIEVGIHHLVAGVGLLGFSIARLLYTRSGEVVVEAHGYLFEVFADLGVAGVLLSLALLGSWLVAAARPLAPRLRWSVLPAGLAAEREGMIALAAGVVAFGVQSALDWTWFFIGVVVPVLLCAGWLAGRGPLQSPAVAPPEAGAGRERSSMLDRLAARPAAAAALVSLVVGTLLACWLIWRPLRSAQELSRSVGYDNTAQAFSAARAAASEDPLAVAPRAWVSQLYLRLGDVAQARAELVDAIERQPHDPATWLALAQFDHGSRPTWSGDRRVSAPARDRPHGRLLRPLGDGPARRAETPRGCTLSRAQRVAAASSIRRSSGGPPAAVRTSTSNPNSVSNPRSERAV